MPNVIQPLALVQGIFQQMPGVYAWVIGEATTYFYFTIEDGHLMLYYLDDTQPPPFSIGADGHLYLEL
jgi:hypothetical protein